MGGIEDSDWYETIFDDSEWFESLIDEIEYSCEETVQRIGAFGCDMMELWSRFSQRIVDLDLTRHSRNFVAGEEHFYDVIPVAEVRNRPSHTYVSDGEVEEETANEHWATCVSKIPESLNQEEEDDSFDDKNTASIFEHTDEDEGTDEEEMGTSDDYDDDDEDGLLEWLEGFVDVKEAEISMPFTECDWVFVKRII